MGAPQTTREALVAEMLGDLDSLLSRVEQLLVALSHSEKKTISTIKALDDAGDKYRIAVDTFNQQAKADLSEFIHEKAIDTASKTIEEQRAALQEIARSTLQSVVKDTEESVKIVRRETVRELHQTRISRLAEHTITALVASSFTTAIWYMLSA